MSKSILPRLTEIAESVVEPAGMELVELEYVKEGRNWILRVTIDQPGGIDIEDCSRISEQLSLRLDEEEPIDHAYLLEVMSPGAERPLKTERDYERAIGKWVFVSTYEPVDGAKQFEGTLLAVDDTTLTIECEQSTHDVPREKVANARLAVKF